MESRLMQMYGMVALLAGSVEEKEHSEEEDAENADYEDDNGGGSAEEGDKDLQRKEAAAKAWEKNYLARASTGVTSSSTVS
jgi:hypothetical protein